MLNEHVGVVLKDVVNGKGKRLEINVRPVLAAEFQIILEGREIHAGLDVAVNVENVSRHRNGKMKLIIERGSTALSLSTSGTRRMRGGQGGSSLQAERP
jgi:hypothetical protein